jgi:AAA+ ATPase superfamily predicted ATPase
MYNTEMYNLVNPFEYRSVALGRQFVDRKEELGLIMECVRSAQNVTLYSPRRYGKSSLILECFRRMRNECIPVYIDFNRINSISDLAERIIEDTARAAYSKVELFVKEMKEALKSLRPEVAFTDEGITVKLRSFEVDRDLEEALRFPQNVAKKKRKRVAVAMDEFQRNAYLDGDIVERLMRSEIQLHNEVSYIFSGSKVSMLREMFEDGDRPFFRTTKLVPIGPIPEKELGVFVKKRFKETKVKIMDKIVDEIVKMCDGHPQRTKQLCFEAWNKIVLDSPIKKKEDLDQLVRRMLKNDDYLVELWYSIKSPLHRRLMIGIAKEGLDQPFSVEFLKKHDLESASHVQRALKSLEKQGIIHEDTIVDPFFRLWILQNAV